jgi:hypothetical protein
MSERLTIADRLAIIEREKQMLEQRMQREEKEEMELTAPSIKLLLDKLVRSKNAFWSAGILFSIEVEDDFTKDDPIHQVSARTVTKLLNVEISRPENAYIGYPPALASLFWEMDMGCCVKPKSVITVQFGGHTETDW